MNNYRKTININLSNVQVRNWTIIFYQDKVYPRCEYADTNCASASRFIAGRGCKFGSNKKYKAVCQRHFFECSGCICGQCNTTELEAKDRRRHETCISLVLPSNTTTQLDDEPSSSGLPMAKKWKRNHQRKNLKRDQRLELKIYRQKQNAWKNVLMKMKKYRGNPGEQRWNQ